MWEPILGFDLFHIWRPIWMGGVPVMDVKPLLMNFRGRDIGCDKGWGMWPQPFAQPLTNCLNFFFWTQPKNDARPTQLKKPCPYILEGCLSTKPILSAPHLQSPKSNICVHFHLVNKQLTRISFLKGTCQ